MGTGVLFLLLAHFSSAQVWTFSGLSQERTAAVPATARQGFQNIAALRINITGVGTTTGVQTPLTFNGFTINYTGTDVNDIQSFNIYQANALNPNNNNLFYSSAAVSGNTLQFTANRAYFNITDFYFWLMVDVRQSATVSNNIQVVASTITINGISYDISTGTITGTTSIVANTPLSGTYTVNTSITGPRNFTSVAAMATAINNNGIDDNGAEFIFEDGQEFAVNNPGVVINNVTNTLPTKKVIFTRSNTGATPPIIIGNEGGATEDALLGFEGWSNVTVSGLTFKVSPAFANPYSYGVFFRSTGQRSCNNNRVTNCVFDFNDKPNLEAPGNNLPNAVYFNATATASERCVANNNYVDNNTITGFPRGIAIRGNTTNTFSRTTSNYVHSNYITNITAIGIQMDHIGNAHVYNNIIENFTINGFILGDGDATVGIRVENTFEDSYVYNNIIRNIANLNTFNGNRRLTAFQLGQRNNRNLFLFNNVVANLQLPNVSGTDVYTSRVINLGDNGTFPSGFYRIFSNTFVNESPVSFCVVFSSGTHNNNALEFRNNILVINTVTGASTTVVGTLYATRFGNTNILSTQSRNNVYFSNNANFTFYRSGNPIATNTAAGFNTFAQYISSRPTEASSQFALPNFLTSVGYELDNINPGILTTTGLGITVPGLGLPGNVLNFDVNGYQRKIATPTIGANELITLVSNIAVAGQGGVNAITTIGGTLQMEANVAPANATFADVTWSVTPSTFASISGTGVLKAFGTQDGLVTVRASATDGSKIFGERVITLSGQVLVSGITVSGTGGQSLISVRGQNLQMLATVAPANASNPVVAWSVDNASIATISGAGMLTPLTDGVVQVTATATDGTGVSGMAVVTLTNQIWVNAINITAPGNNFTITVDKATLQLDAEVLPANASNKAIVWAANPSDVGTISQTGLVSPVGNGLLTVTATALDAGGFSASRVITISGQITLPQSVTIAPTGNITVFSVRGGNLQFTETVLPATTTDKSVTWSVTPITRATISGSGMLTAIADGPVTVTAVSNAVASISGFYLLSLSNQNAVTSVSVSGTATSVLAGNSILLSATVSPANASNPAITWASSNNAVATVSGIGQVRGLSSGVVTITATSVDVPSVQGMYVVTVIQRVTAITVSGTGGINTISVLGGTLQMEATVAPATATNPTVTWTVSNEAIATINSVTGLLQAVANGTVLVTASAVDGSGVTGFRTVSITNQTVAPPPTTITSFTLSGSSTVNVGATIALSALIEPNTVTVSGLVFTSSDASVATVTNDGEVTGVSAGVVTITGSFTLDSQTYTAAKEVTVTADPTGVAASLANQIVVAPNPAVGGIITLIAAKNLRYSLVNSVGKTIATGVLQAGNNSITGVSAGIYSLTVFDATAKATLKVAVE